MVDDLAASRDSLATKLTLFSFESVWSAASMRRSHASAPASASTWCSPDELMPVKGGLDLLASLRSDPRYARLPFVLLSLFGADHAAVAGWPHQPDAIGLKPIRADRLAKLMTRCSRARCRAPPRRTVRDAHHHHLPRPPHPPGRGQSGESARRPAAPAEARRRRDPREQRRRSPRAPRRGRRSMPY